MTDTNFFSSEPPIPPEEIPEDFNGYRSDATEVVGGAIAPPSTSPNNANEEFGVATVRMGHMAMTEVYPYGTRVRLLKDFPKARTGHGDVNAGQVCYIVIGTLPLLAVAPIVYRQSEWFYVLPSEVELETA